jgi:hypothetical protein
MMSTLERISLQLRARVRSVLVPFRRMAAVGFLPEIVPSCAMPRQHALRRIADGDSAERDDTADRTRPGNDYHEDQ